MTAVFPHKNNTSMNKSNTLYWKTATEPAERIEVRLVLNSYIDNDNLYVGLESRGLRRIRNAGNPTRTSPSTSIPFPRSMPMWTTGTATDMYMIS